MKKKFCLLIILTLVFCISGAQDYNNTMNYNFQAPEVATFNTYGNIPVNLYTGAPDISIPLYTIKEGDLEIPIELRYNIHNVKPDNYPGIVGLGWNLFAGGNITRIQRGAWFDEYKTDLENWGFLGRENRLSDSWGSCENCYDFSEIIDPSAKKQPWYHSDRLDLESNFISGEGRYDSSPDKFVFNFLGYTGSFYRSHTGEWVVDSETRFKVTHKVVNYEDLRSQIVDGINNQGFKISRLGSLLKSSSFLEFTLTAPNGTIFKFGGKNATDYSVEYFGQNMDSTFPVATTWHLISVTTPNCRKIDYNYAVTDPIISGDFSFIMIGGYSNPLLRGLNFHLIMPVQLKSIACNYEELVKFNYEETTQLKYATEYCNDWGSYNGESLKVQLDLTKMISNTYPTKYNFAFIDSLDDLKWNKLTEIQLIDSTKYILEYTNSSEERLKLLSLTKANSIDKYQEKHTFKYNEQKLPPYLSGHYDHLGFYNGKDFSITLKQSFYTSDLKQLEENYKLFDKLREGDSSGEYVKAEMLKEIHYPTGGYSEFIYEPNTVARCVIPARTSLRLASLTRPGGLRIKEIINYTKENSIFEKKSYNYNGSGILSFTPMYYMETSAWNYQLQKKETLTFFSSGSANHAFFDLEGSPLVGYSSVLEYEEDGEGNKEGYTHYHFNGYDKYFDELPIQCYNDFGGNGLALSPFTPFVSHAKKRGHLAGKEIYDKDENKKESYQYDYTKRLEKKVRNIQAKPISPGSGYFYMFGGSYESSLYSYKISKETKTFYDGNIEMTTTKEYSYNQENSLTNEVVTLDNEEKMETQRKYTGDLFRENNPQASSPYASMKNRYMYTYPVETTVHKNGKTISAEIKDYKSMSKGGLTETCYVSDIYRLETDVPLADYKHCALSGNALSIDNRCKQEIKYIVLNRYGLPNSIETPSGKTSYFWSYRGKYPILEIKDITMDELAPALGYNSIYVDLISETPGNAGWIINDIKKKMDEKLPHLMYSSYLYKPYTGVISYFDFRGEETTYDYDGLGRLKTIKDGEGRILEAYRYKLRVLEQ